MSGPERRRRCLPLHAIALGLAAASPARAGSLSCLADSFAEVDRERLAVVRARVDDVCACADFAGVSPGGAAADVVLWAGHATLTVNVVGA